MRHVLPEILDSLPHDDPSALRSRDELRVINLLMGNHRWLLRMLRAQGLEGTRVLELGAGDGALAQQVWQAGLVPPQQWSALDLAPAPTDWPTGANWLQQDLFTLSTLPEADIIVANLFLHHFQNQQLLELGRRLPDTCRVLIACEPARRALHTWQGHLLSAIAELSDVTHHDMLVSIRAGFIGSELADSMGLKGWNTVASQTILGAYRLVAWR